MKSMLHDTQALRCTLLHPFNASMQRQAHFWGQPASAHQAAHLQSRVTGTMQQLIQVATSGPFPIRTIT